MRDSRTSETGFRNPDGAKNVRSSSIECRQDWQSRLDMDNRAQADYQIKELLRGLGSDRAERFWAGFLDGYAPLIQQVVRTFAKDEDGISEGFIFVCQRLCHNRFRRLRSYDPQGPARFETWLRVVAQRLCLDWRRHKTGRFRLFKSIARLSRLERELFRRLYREGLGLESAFESLRPLFPGLTRAEVESGAGRIAKSLSPRDRTFLLAWYSRVDPLPFEKDGPQPEEVALSRQPDPESAAISSQQAQRLERAAQTLSPQDRLILRLRFEKELTLSEIARLTGLKNPQQADRRLHKVLDELQRVLKSQKS